MVSSLNNETNNRAGTLLLSMSIPLLAAGVSLASADDLVSVYRLARDHDPKFRAAEATHLAEREKPWQARSTLFPSVDARASHDRNSVETVTDRPIVSRPVGQSKYSSSEYSLNVSQPIFNVAAFAGLRQAKADARRAEAEYAAAAQELILRVAQAYLDLLLAHDTLELNHAERISIHRQLDSAQERLKAGFATVTEVHDAKARYETAAAQAIEAEKDLQDKREAVRELTNQMPEALARVAADMPLIPPDPADMKHWIEKSMAQNYTLLAKREALVSAREEIRRRFAGHYPTLDLVGQRTRDDADGSLTGPGVRSDETVVGLQLKLPIFQGGFVSSRTQEAEHRFSASQQDLEAARRAAERATRSAYLGVESGAARVNALKQAVVASESALAAKTKGFAAGIGTHLDVLDASRELFRAQRDLASARYNYLLNLLRLKQAAGVLSEDDLMQINVWLR